MRWAVLVTLPLLVACSGTTQVRLSGSVDVAEDNPATTWTDCTPLGPVSGEGLIGFHHGGRPPAETLDTAQNDALRNLRMNAKERGATVLHLEKATWDTDQVVLDATAFRCRAERTTPVACASEGDRLVTCAR